MGTAGEVALNAGKLAISSGIGFGLGCLVGKLSQVNMFLTGGLFAVTSAASTGLDILVKSLAGKYDWNLSTVNYITAATQVLTSLALSVSCLALGILSPLGFGLAVGLGVAFSAVPLGLGLYAQYGGKDMTFAEAKKQEGVFYSFAV